MLSPEKYQAFLLPIALRNYTISFFFSLFLLHLAQKLRSQWVLYVSGRSREHGWVPVDITQAAAHFSSLEATQIVKRCFQVWWNTNFQLHKCTAPSRSWGTFVNCRVHSNKWYIFCEEEKMLWEPSHLLKVSSPITLSLASFFMHKLSNFFLPFTHKKILLNCLLFIF